MRLTDQCEHRKGVLSPRIAFCATGKTGLGHLRRVTNVAAAIKARAPHIPLTMVTNAPVAGLAADERALFASELIVPRDEMARQLALEDHSLIVVDTAKIPEVAYLPAATCLILREVMAEKLHELRLPAGRPWDCVIVPAPADAWRPDADAIGARSIVNAGWIYRAAAGDHVPVLPSRARQPRILVAFGGGASEELAGGLRDAADRLIEGLKSAHLGAFEVLQVLGPRARPTDRLRHATRIVDVGANLHLAFAEADLVLTSVGYNSTLELASTTTPAVLLPIACTYDDQWQRARWWEPHIGNAFDPADIDRTVSYMCRIIACGERRAAYDAGETGAGLATEHLIRLAEAGFCGPRFAKPFKSGCRLAPEQSASASRELFARGVRTLPQRSAEADTVMVEIAAMSGRQKLAAAGPKRQAWDCARWSSLIGSMMRPLVALHETVAERLSLKPYDAFDRISPRLTASGLERLTASNALRSQLETLVAEARRAISLVAAGREDDQRPIHGDFHAGQVLFEPGNGDHWIIDLDDLALGWPEADLANFAAHLATSPDLYRGHAGDGFRALAAVAVSEYQRLSDRQLNSARIEVFGAAALLRRVLKCAEQRRPGIEPGQILEAVANCLMRCGNSGVHLREVFKDVVSGNGSDLGPDLARAGARSYAQ